MSFEIIGVGTAVPDGQVTQEDAARLAVAASGEHFNWAATLPTLYGHTQIRTRHSVLISSSSNGRPATQSFFPMAKNAGDRGPTTAARIERYEANAANLAARAVEAAIENASCSAQDISHLVTVSCSGFSAPGVDILLIERLGLPRDVSRTHVGFMGCHGALNGLRVASALSAARPGSKVLVSCVEICSIHHQYTTDFQQIVANALFSDGAAAVVGARAVSEERPWQIVDQRSYVLPDTEDLMSWRIGDHGFQMTLSMQVPTIIRDNLRPWLGSWLREHELEVADIRGWAIHPGGPMILSACEEALQLGPAQVWASHEVLAEFGNMSSPTVLFILQRLRSAGESLPCVMLAFGPGLVIEAALIR